MKVGIFVTNQNPLGTDMVSALDEQFAMTRLARDRGWDAVGTGQHYLSEGMSQLQLIPFLGRLAAEAGEMTGVAGVLLINLHNPVEVAECIASLDVIWRGNFVFGVGLGYREVEFDAFKVPKGQRLRRFEECLEIVKRLWTEDRVTFEGQFWRLENATIAPKPVQRPRPPLWFGGSHPVAIRRAARMADGWIGAGSSSTGQFADAVGTLREALVAQGRDPSTFPVAKRVYVALDPNAERARSRLRRWFSMFYRDPEAADRVAVFGPSDACVTGIAAVAKAGAGLIVLNPVFDAEEQTELLVTEVIPGVLAE